MPVGWHIGRSAGFDNFTRVAPQQRNQTDATAIGPLRLLHGREQPRSLASQQAAQQAIDRGRRQGKVCAGLASGLTPPPVHRPNELHHRVEPAHEMRDQQRRHRQPLPDSFQPRATIPPEVTEIAVMLAPQRLISRYGDQHVAARLHHRQQRRDQGKIVRNMLDDIVEQDDICRAFGRAKIGRCPPAGKLHAGKPLPGEVDAGSGSIDAMAVIIGGQGGDVGAGPAANIDHSPSGGGRCHCCEQLADDRAAADEPPVGLFDRGMQVELIVVHRRIAA